MRRIFPGALLLSACGAAVFALVSGWPDVRNELFVLVGNRNEAGGYYGFWSGLGGATIIFSGLFTSLLIHWRHANCHADRCPRIGRFPVAGGAYKVCGKHHAHITGRSRRLTADALRAAHTLHSELLHTGRIRGTGPPS